MICRIEGCTNPTKSKKADICLPHHRKERKLIENTYPCATCGVAERVKGLSYCVECKAEFVLKSRLARYGITPEQWRKMLVDQDWKCAVCFEEIGEDKNTCVDHDHGCCPSIYSCGECVRGLLCYACNRGLGFLRDDVVRLRGAIDYLQKGKKV